MAMMRHGLAVGLACLFVGCNAISGLDQNYSESDCFPLPRCADSSMSPDGALPDGALRPDGASPPDGAGTDGARRRRRCVAGP